MKKIKWHIIYLVDLAIVQSGRDNFLRDAKIGDKPQCLTKNSP
jgi:hypothetical protein